MAEEREVARPPGSRGDALRRGVPALAVLPLTVLAALAAGCGGSPPHSSAAPTTSTRPSHHASTTTTRPAGGATSTTTTAGRSTTTAPGPVQGPLGAVITRLQAGAGATFGATYAVTSSAGAQSVTYQQQPPVVVLVTSSGRILESGSSVEFCPSTAGQGCVAAGSEATVSALTQLFRPSQVLTTLQGVQTQLATGATVTGSSRVVAGIPSTCVTVTGHPGAAPATYCVSDQGVLTSATTSLNSVTLTAYDPSPPASSFVLPPTVPAPTSPAG